MAISGATAATYAPLTADVGHTLVAVVTATNPDRAVPATSQPSAVVLPAAPRWKALPAISQDPGHVGDMLTITPGVWSGPSVTTDTVELMRCTNVCLSVPMAAGGTYTIITADTGAILRVRETATNAGGTTVVWSSAYVGPVSSITAGWAVVGAGQAAVRNVQGAVLAFAQVSGPPALTADTTGLVHTLIARHRQVKLRRAKGVTGTLRAWVCAVGSSRRAAPGACTRRITVHGSATLSLPASMTGRVRIVVVRSRH